MYPGLFCTLLRRDIKRSTPVVQTGMMCFLPSNGIDAIERWQIGRPTSAICSRFGIKKEDNLRLDQAEPRS